MLDSARIPPGDIPTEGKEEKKRNKILAAFFFSTGGGREGGRKLGGGWVGYTYLLVHHRRNYRGLMM